MLRSSAALDKAIADLKTRVPANPTPAETADPTSLASQLSRLQALRGADDPTMRVQALADLPTDPVSPKKKLSLIAGVLGGAYGMNGPPLAMYGAFRRWPPDRFRATLQAYFLPASVIGMAGYWLAGLWTTPVTRFYLTSLPGVLVAILLGRVLNRRLDTERLVVYIYSGLILVGLMLLAQAMRG